MEKIQRDDPETVTFEKFGERRYKFRQRAYMSREAMHMQNVEELLERLAVAAEKGGKPRQD